MSDNQFIEQIEQGVKSLHEKVESHGKQSAEVKAFVENIKGDIERLEKSNQDLKAKSEADTERLAIVEAAAAKSKSAVKVDAVEIKQALDSAFSQLTKEAKGQQFNVHELAKKARTVNDPALGGHLVDERTMMDMMVTYMKEASPMLREANVVRSSNAIVVPYKKLFFDAKHAAELQASGGKTKRLIDTRTIALSRIYTEDYTTEEFLRSQSFETESTLASDLMSDISYQIQYLSLRGDGREKAYGLLNEQFLTDTAVKSDAAAGKLTWTDLFKVQKAFNPDYGNKYREQGKFFLTFDALYEFLVEKDLENRPIYMPGINGMRQSTLAGHEFVIMNNMDKVVAANTLPVLFGDMKRAYTIVVDGNYKTIRDEITQMQSGIITIGMMTMAGGSVIDEEAIRAIKGA